MCWNIWLDLSLLPSLCSPHRILNVWFGVVHGGAHNASFWSHTHSARREGKKARGKYATIYEDCIESVISQGSSFRFETWNFFLLFSTYLWFLPPNHTNFSPIRVAHAVSTYAIKPTSALYSWSREKWIREYPCLLCPILLN